MESVNPLQFLKDKTILVTGATGFLAKIFVEKILRIQPNVKKLYLLVRAPDSNSAMKRIHDEVAEKELFSVLRDKLGANLKSFILQKMVAVAGDVSDMNLGVKDSKLMEEMWREIEVVINFAATTDFDERYDFAFDINTMGALHVLNFAKNCDKINLVLHVSTAYVCGEGSGLIQEKPIYNGEALNKTCKLEITAEKKLIDEKLNQLQAEDAAENEVNSTMKDLGSKRARFYGWPNTYVFTKAMGEMILGKYRDKTPLVIIRPTMITSTFAEPFPGWTEGVRTIDGPIVGYGKGRLKFLLANPETILDTMPADMVVNSMIIAMVANTKKSSQIIYQIGSSMRNPLKLTNFNKFMTQYFTEHPLINKDGNPIKVSKVTLFKTSASFRVYMGIRYVMPLKVWKLISFFYQKYKDVCIDLDKKLKFVMRLVDLYKPYMFFKGIFDDTNSQKLRITIAKSGQEVDAFNFDPKCIDWEDYIINTHIAGLVKYVLKSCSDVKSLFNSFPAGYRFDPTDAELVVYFLRKKVMNEALPLNMIIEIKLREHNPETIAEMYEGTGLKEFYFFTPRYKKYPNGNQQKRTAGDGHWKATGSEKPIVFNGKVVGFKKSLVFYEGKPPKGRKTNWIMHEFRVKDAPPSKTSSNSEKLDDWGLCRIYNKVDNKPRKIFLDLPVNFSTEN